MTVKEQQKLKQDINAEISQLFDELNTATKTSGKADVLPTKQVQAIKDIFGPGSNLQDRYVHDYEKIASYSSALKGLKQKVVYTTGVWDLIHIGHCRYFEKAKSLGDILIVGVELDQAVRMRKGPRRPIIPFKERVEMLSHIRHIDLVVPVCDFDERGLSGMGLEEAIHPDIFIASERSFREADDTDEWISRVKALSGEVVILQSQAETSTSGKIRDLLIDMGQVVKDSMNEAKKAMDTAFQEVMERVDEAINKV
jgi:rfaE bifunctional protein nucleotidyltransferase chain/domain